MAYLNTGKYNEAIDYLNKFKSDDIVLSGLATGAIGDAYADNKPEEALKNYVKAAGINKNDFTTPRFLLKAGRQLWL
jgi:tetratricopeptide (TPR) repeat protein